MSTLPSDSSVRVGFHYLCSKLTARTLWVVGSLVIRSCANEIPAPALHFRVSEEVVQVRDPGHPGIWVRPLRVCVRLIILPICRQTLTSMPIHSAVRMTVAPYGGEVLERPLSYTLIGRRRRHLHGRIHALPEQNSSVYVRQSAKNRLYITVRPRNHTDSPWMTPRIALARLMSRFMRHDKVLLYEKNASRYEEGASIVFERLIDSGYRHVRFVLAKSEIASVPERYRRYVLPRFSLGHFAHLFSARTLLGTEVPAHAAELRTANRTLLRFLNSGQFTFVHLQHGVMYMVSLDSDARKMVRQGKDFPRSTKVVCSSQAEADHFVEQADFPREDLYITGLPKFDRATREPDADKILIMPTWRPWEYNSVRKDALETSYGRELMEMLDAVPQHLRDKVYLLPHPLVREAFLGTPMEDLMWKDGSYDEALRQCALLITDYSSIAYDAFYRGARVVFWWKDKDECMAQYGGRLMLEEGTAFGPVCYTADELRQAVLESYQAEQSAEDMRRFKRIVEFADGENTRRVVEALKRDGLIGSPQS